MRARILVLLGAMALLLGPTEGQTQNPGGGNFQMRRGLGGGGMPDPGQTFDRLAAGKQVLTRNDITNPFMQQMFDRMTSSLNITNGQLTRDQYVQASQQMMAQWQGGGGRMGGGQNGGGSAPVVITATSPTAAPTPLTLNATPPDRTRMWNPAGVGNWAENFFRRLDRNGDGILNSDEMPEALKSEVEKWDANRDGFIDLSEFKTYFQARMQQFQTDRATASDGGAPWWNRTELQPTATTKPTEDAAPQAVVYRAGKLPPQLPPWFAQLDTDQDGQVGLYEWKTSGRPISEFLQIDRNNDGFLTVDEVLKSSAGQSGPTSSPGALAMGPGGMGFNRVGAGGGFQGRPGGGGFQGRMGGGWQGQRAEQPRIIQSDSTNDGDQSDGGNGRKRRPGGGRRMVREQ